MNPGVGEARIGQWYCHTDKGEMFQVTALDPGSKAIEIQNFDGDVDEIDEEVWSTLPLELTEPPEDWTGPMDAVNVDEVADDSPTEMTVRDWQSPLQSLPAAAEAWESAQETAEDDPQGHGRTVETPALDDPTADRLLG